MFNDRRMPHNSNVEEMIVAACMNRGENIQRCISSGLMPEMFHTPKCAQIYGVLVSEWTKTHLDIDPLAVVDALAHSGALEEVGGEVAVLEIAAKHSSDIYINKYIYNTIRDYCRCQMAVSSSKLAIDMLDSDNFSELIEKHIANARKFASLAKCRESMDTLSLLKRTCEMIENINDRPDAWIVPYCITGMSKYIRHKKRQLHVLGGRSGTGKTGFVLSVIAKQIQHGFKHALFCAETSSRDLMERLLAIKAGVSVEEIENLNDNPHVRSIYVKAMGEIHGCHHLFRIYGKGDYVHSAAGIEAELVRAMDEGFVPDMVSVDYIQNIRAANPKAPRHEQIEENIFLLNGMFGRLNVAGLVLSQLNRDKQRDHGAYNPHMGDLKGSSGIEQEGDYVTFLQKADNQDVNAEYMELLWYSDKVRGSQTINTKLKFSRKNGKILEAA